MDWKLNKDIWMRILNNMNDFYGTCQLALSHKFLYKMVGIDFKKLCLDNKLFRLPGESWSDVVFDAHNRLWNDGLRVNSYRVVLAYGENTYLFCFVGADYVVVTNFDFTTRYVRYIKVGFRIYRAHLIQEGKYLVVFCDSNEDVVNVYNVDSGERISKDDLLTIKFSGCLLSYISGLVRDVLTQKTIKIDAVDDEVDVAGPYVLFKKSEGNNCVINFNTGEEYPMETYDQCYSTKILADSGCVLIQYYSRRLMEIHHVDSKRIIYKFSLADVWKVINDAMILREDIGQCLVFDCAKCEWGYSPNIHLNVRKNQTLNKPWDEIKNFAYFDTIKAMDRNRVHLEFEDDYDSEEDADFVPNPPPPEDAVDEDDIDYQYYGDGVGVEITEEDVEILYFNIASNHRVHKKVIKARARRPHPFVALRNGLLKEAERKNVKNETKIMRMQQCLNNWILQTQFSVSEAENNVSF